MRPRTLNHLCGVRICKIDAPISIVTVQSRHRNFFEDPKGISEWMLVRDELGNELKWDDAAARAGWSKKSERRLKASK